MLVHWSRPRRPGRSRRLKIGMITSLSGPGAYLGEDIRDGFKLAIAMQGGKLGGVPVDLVIEDDAVSRGQGKQIVDRMLKNEQIKLFTGIVFSNVAVRWFPTYWMRVASMSAPMQVRRHSPASSAIRITSW